MFQFIDARLQPITAEVTNGLEHDERPNGSGREPGGWRGAGQSARWCPDSQVVKPFLNRNLAQKNTAGGGVSVPPHAAKPSGPSAECVCSRGAGQAEREARRAVSVPGEAWPCPRRSVVGCVPLPWSQPEGASRVELGWERSAGGICLDSTSPSAGYFVRCVVPHGNLALQARNPEHQGFCPFPVSSFPFSVVLSSVPSLLHRCFWLLSPPPGWHRLFAVLPGPRLLWPADVPGR